MKTISSFTVNHDKIVPGMYISRIDGDITTFDLRTRKPTNGNYMDNLTMHSVEHMFATVIRNSPVGEHVVYFGPMGCQTGFYLLTSNLKTEGVYQAVLQTLEQIAYHETQMYGQSQKECGNYKNLDLNAAKIECAALLDILKKRGPSFSYPEESR